MSQTTELIKKYFESLEVSKFYELTFMHSKIGQCVVDSETGNFILVNDACCDIWNRTKEDLLSRNWQSITEPAYIEIDSKLVGDVRSGEIEYYELAKIYLIPPNHTPIPAILEVIQLYDIDGVKQPFLLSKIIPESLLINWTEKLSKIRGK